MDEITYNARQKAQQAYIIFERGACEAEYQAWAGNFDGARRLLRAYYRDARRTLKDYQKAHHLTPAAKDEIRHMLREIIKRSLTAQDYIDNKEDKIQ